jgi:hypothetical protein
MADWGLKISVAGKSISSTTPEDFVFSSKNDNNVKIVIKNGTTVTVNGSSSADVTITHSLGFIPMVMLFAEFSPGSGKWYMGVPLVGSSDTYINSDPAYTYVDSTYFKFRITNSTGSQKTVSFYYFIFGDSAN